MKNLLLSLVIVASALSANAFTLEASVEAYSITTNHYKEVLDLIAPKENQVYSGSSPYDEHCEGHGSIFFIDRVSPYQFSENVIEQSESVLKIKRLTVSADYLCEVVQW